MAIVWARDLAVKGSRQGDILVNQHGGGIIRRVKGLQTGCDAFRLFGESVESANCGVHSGMDHSVCHGFRLEPWWWTHAGKGDIQISKTFVKRWEWWQTVH